MEKTNEDHMGFVKKAPQLQDYMETIWMTLKAEIPKQPSTIWMTLKDKTEEQSVPTQVQTPFNGNMYAY
jgi:hypothetical protein